MLAAREAMANAARHSGADQVSVFVDVGEDEIAIFVRDRGSGFDPDARAGGLARDRRVDPRPDDARGRHRRRSTSSPDGAPRSSCACGRQP